MTLVAIVGDSAASLLVQPQPNSLVEVLRLSRASLKVELDVSNDEGISDNKRSAATFDMRMTSTLLVLFENGRFWPLTMTHQLRLCCLELRRDILNYSA